MEPTTRYLSLRARAGERIRIEPVRYLEDWRIALIDTQGELICISANTWPSRQDVADHVTDWLLLEGTE